MNSNEGVWWLPTYPQLKVNGTLHISDEGDISLELHGTLSGPDVEQHPTPLPNEKALASMNVYPLIVGASHTGTQITLCRCKQTKRMVSVATLEFSGLATYSVDVVFFGGHFLNEVDVRFHRFRLEYSHLPDWSNITGFNGRLIPKAPTPDIVKAPQYEIAYVPPEPVTTPISQGTVTFAAEAFTAPGSNDYTRQVVLHQRVWVEFAVNEELPLDVWIANYVHPIQQLLSLATSRPNHVLNIQGFSRHVTRPFNLMRMVRNLNRGLPPGAEDDQEPITMVINTLLVDRSFSAKRLMRYEMLFTLADLEGELGRYLDNWLASAQELDSVYKLFFGILFTREMGTEQRFLNLVQAAESYHRRCFPNNVLPLEEHMARVSTVLNSCPEANREWLEEQLRWSNEPRLKRRLKDLVEMAGSTLAPLVGDSTTKRNKFIQKVVDTRNYLTHYDHSLFARAAHGDDLEQLTRVIMLLVQICFLRQLGLPDMTWKTLFEQYSAYQLALNQGSAL